MAPIMPGRMAATLDGDFVVFLIGARINRLRDIRGWLPVVRAMPRMLKELSRHPELGLLATHTLLEGWREVVVVQYWRSFDHLHAYARAREAEHLPAWAEYNRLLRNNTSVGIWHETYLVRAAEYEAIYGNMPPRGLGVAGTLQAASGKTQSALGRLGRSDGTDQPPDAAGQATADCPAA